MTPYLKGNCAGTCPRCKGLGKVPGKPPPCHEAMPDMQEPGGCGKAGGAGPGGNAGAGMGWVGN